MKVLLDTCVLSELQKKRVNSNVKRTIEKLSSDDMFVSVISLGEIRKGITLLPKGKKKSNLDSWMESLLGIFEDRVLGIDAEIAQTWGFITAIAGKKGVTIPAVDGLLAATANVNGLYLMTRNVSHFKNAGISVIDPWTD